MGATDTSLTFHEAWDEAKDRADYHKPDWNRAQRHHEGETHHLDTWLTVVRRAAGPVDPMGRDASRPGSIDPAKLTALATVWATEYSAALTELGRFNTDDERNRALARRSAVTAVEAFYDSLGGP